MSGDVGPATGVCSGSVTWGLLCGVCAPFSTTGVSSFPFLMWLSPIPFPDEETDMDVHDRGMLYYRLLKHDIAEVGVTYVSMTDFSLLLCRGQPLTTVLMLSCTAGQEGGVWYFTTTSH